MTMKYHASSKLANILTPKERYAIIESLKKNSQGIALLSKSLHMDKPTVSYHLSILEQNDIVTSQYKLIRSPDQIKKISKYYSLNKKQLPAIENFLTMG